MPQENKIHKINDYIYLCESKIHNKGVFALKNISSGTKLLEYKGELISKKEGTRREEESIKLSKKNPSLGATYIMEIDEENDLDGDTENNYAKYINHSCEPNCEFEVEGKAVWIYSTKNIKKDEEICCDYGFDFDEKNPFLHECKCGSKNCVGYIVQEEQREKLKEHLKKNKLKTNKQ